MPILQQVFVLLDLSDISRLFFFNTTFQSQGQILLPGVQLDGGFWGN